MGKLVFTLQQEDVLSLLKICNDYDDTGIEINFNREKGNITDLLYYEEQQLVGYMVIYPSYKVKDVIVMGFVHPEYRNKGIFTYLLEEAKKTLKQQDKNKMIFMIDQLSVSGRQFVESKCAEYTISSYHMIYDVDFELRNSIEIEVIEPSMDDIDDLVQIGMTAFETTDEEERPLAINNINDKSRRLLAAKVNHQLVGIVVTVKSGDRASIGDLAVLPSYRKQGIGTTLLIKSIQLLLDEKIFDIRLGVHANNDTALALYQNNGFVIAKAEDFYELSF